MKYIPKHQTKIKNCRKKSKYHSNTEYIYGLNYSVVSGIMEKDMDIRSNNKIYNLNGICIASDYLASIPSGIYIVNGKKQIIK